MNRAWKQVALWAGVLLVLIGLPALIGLLIWLVLLTSIRINNPFSIIEARIVGMLALAYFTLFMGGGFVLIAQAAGALRMKVSRPLHLPGWWVFFLGTLAAMALGAGLRAHWTGAFIFPLVYVAAAGLPPMAAFTWALADPAGRDAADALTWRKFIVCVLLGGTFSVLLAILLETILPLLGLVLVNGLYDAFASAWRQIIDELAGGSVAQAITSYGFIIALVQLAVIAPLAEELAKPLFILPLIRRAGGPRLAFTLGATAGLGFAAVENLIYTGMGVSAWPGVLALRGLGAAIHPLGAGLSALGWYEAFQAQAAGLPAGRVWLKRFAMAVGLHALWNGGSLVIITLSVAQFFGPAPARLDILGVTLFGSVLALLVVAGAAAWAGLRVDWSRPVQDEAEAPEAGASPPASAGLPSDLDPDRALAIWAVACLVVILPLGLAVLWALW